MLWIRFTLGQHIEALWRQLLLVDYLLVVLLLSRVLGQRVQRGMALTDIVARQHATRVSAGGQARRRHISTDCFGDHACRVSTQVYHSLEVVSRNPTAVVVQRPRREAACGRGIAMTSLATRLQLVLDHERVPQVLLRLASDLLRGSGTQVEQTSLVTRYLLEDGLILCFFEPLWSHETFLGFNCAATCTFLDLQVCGR